MHQLIEAELTEVAALCRRYGARRLELFGSATRRDFDLATSDIDLLVDLDPPPGLGYADAYFGLKEELEKLFARPVDLVSRAAVRNPYFRREIESSRRLLDAA